MSEEKKWGLETTCTRKYKKRQMKVRQTDDHLVGKNKKQRQSKVKQTDDHLLCKNKKKQQSKDRQINDRDWVGLPDYLIEIVIGKLPLVDCLSFSCVCKSWKSITTKLFKRSSRGIPLLVKPGQIENITRTCINVLDKNMNSTFDISMPEEYIGSYVWGSYRDWLIFGRLVEGNFALITLLNPFSGENVVLPEIYDSYHMLVLSSVPSDPKCIYMVVNKTIGVAVWTSGAQRWFAWIIDDFRTAVDALYHDGHFYLLDTSYNIAIVDVKSVHERIFNIDRRIAVEVIGSEKPSFEWSECTRTYLVESSGDILLMCRIFYYGGPRHLETRGFETFRLDVSQREWVKLESLGDKVIFLGRSCSGSFNAKEELGDDALANDVYFSNNCFTYGSNQWKYFTQFFEIRDESDVDDWGVYRLHSEESDWPRAFRNYGKHWAGFWVTAPIWWCLRQQTLEHQ